MRNAFVAILVCMLTAGAFAQNVNKSELESIANQRIQFLNYEGPPQKVETQAQITGIGSFLGRNLVGTAGTRDYAARYRVIHAVDPTITNGLDADIFIIEKAAQVDHIDNIRLILAGFFRAAYGYNQADSTLLAYFTTIYNAVYRGNMTFFEGRYKSIVVKNLSPENAGIATAYTEWPGRTRMVIPLGPGAAGGVLGSLSPTELVSPRVIDELRMRQDMGIEQRKAMVDLLERVIQQKQGQLQQQSPAQDAGQQGAQQSSTPPQGAPQQAAQQQATGAQQTQQQAEQPGTQSPATTQSSQTQQTPAQSAATQQTQEDIQQLQQAVREQRDQIARDQRLLLDQSAAQTAASASAQDLAPITFLQIVGSPKTGTTTDGVTVPFGRLVKVNPLTFEPVQASPVKIVLGRHVVLVGELAKPVVIAANSDLPQDPAVGANGKDSLQLDPTMGRLVRLDGQTLAVDKVGPNVIFPASILEYRDNVLYAVVHDAGQWYLGRFDTDLKLTERSAVEVNPYTTMTFSGGRVWVQTADNRIVPLLVQDLRVAR